MKTITLFLIFIADYIRQGNFPRVDQFQYCNEREKYLYLGRPLTAEEFNKASAHLFSPDFTGAQGFTFQPQVIEVKVEVEDTGETADEHFKRLVDEIEANPRLQEKINARVAELAGKFSARPSTPPAAGSKYLVAVDPSTAANLSEPDKQSTGFKSVAIDPETEQGPVEPVFSLRGKLIYDHETKIGELAGESKKLRVITQYKDLRPKIEAWLETKTA